VAGDNGAAPTVEGAFARNSPLGWAYDHAVDATAKIALRAEAIWWGARLSDVDGHLYLGLTGRRVGLPATQATPATRPTTTLANPPATSDRRHRAVVVDARQ
jgi:hypothetical protein